MKLIAAFVNSSVHCVAKVSRRASAMPLLLLLILGSSGLARAQAVVGGDSPAVVASNSGRSQPSVVPAAQVSTPTATRTPSQGEDEKSNEAVPNDASHQGIKVHGHWAIDVKNPDGTLAQHREFENSLVDLGEVMAYLLSGEITAGEPAIFLDPNGFFTPCNASECVLAANSNGYWANTDLCKTSPNVCSYNVTETPKKVSSTLFGVTSTSFLLVVSGQITATNSASISSVATSFATCQSTNHILYNLLAQVSPATCVLGDTLPSGTQAGATPSSTAPNFFTQTTLTNPVQVTAGQVVLVTVTFSFS